MLNIDPDRPVEEIQREIMWATQQRGFPSLPLVAFSALLLKLSNQANQSGIELRHSVDDLKSHITELDKKNGKLQRAVTALTIVSVLLALVQVLLAAVPYFFPPPTSGNEKPSVVLLPTPAALPAQGAALRPIDTSKPTTTLYKNTPRMA